MMSGGLGATSIPVAEPARAVQVQRCVKLTWKHWEEAGSLRTVTHLDRQCPLKGCEQGINKL